MATRKRLSAQQARPVVMRSVSQPEMPTGQKARARKGSRVTPFPNKENASPSSGSFISPETKFRLQQERHTLGRALEMLGVTFVSLLLSGGAVIGIVHLAKYQKVQLDRLKELDREVAVMEAQIELQRERLAQAFSTGGQQDALLHREGFLDPDEMSIKLIEREKQTIPPSVTAEKWSSF
ncbi:MAG: hypothetical protein RMK91_03785 [Pseudanabaenaceae cyanobacterium SKYGB_i_bin29]|nr:hypothetical protein [Pseudanabaenaceae cyanobacterium SKYG29]MDW8420963.1 hypothetical protein [Pseudanabaenaceae cyanobacterium SKYGB_i_bin29]